MCVKSATNGPLWSGPHKSQALVSLAHSSLLPQLGTSSAASNAKAQEKENYDQCESNAYFCIAPLPPSDTSVTTLIFIVRYLFPVHIMYIHVYNVNIRSIIV